MQFSPLLFQLVLISPKYSPQHTTVKQSQPTFLPQYERQSFTPTENNRQNIFLYKLSFKFLDNKVEEKDSATNESKHAQNSICP